MPITDKPMIMVAHSMGAHIGLRYLKEHEGVFDSAMLTSPMLDIQTAGLPKPLARQMAKFAKAGNYLEKYIPGGSDRTGREAFENNNKTSDTVRFEAANDIIEHNPKLAIGDPTYGWIYHTFASIDILNDEKYLKAINTPILMEVSDSEKIVDRAAQDRALKLLPNVQKIDISGAQHEIWQEQDKYRNQWLAKVDEFLAERLKNAAPAPKKPSPPAAPKPPAP
jgi:lysophospholipase